MYALYAEDTRDKAFTHVRDLASKRFSRAMREAEKEPKMAGCRFFIVEVEFGIGPKMDTRAYLGVTRKPAPVGSSENQAHQRATLRWQKPSVRSGKVDWNEQNEQGETLGEVMVDIIRRDLARQRADAEARKQVGLS